MKAYVVVKTFKDGHKQGVLFTERQDAEDAFDGCESGSSLACEWTALIGGANGCPLNVDREDEWMYEDFDLHENVEIVEIEI